MTIGEIIKDYREKTNSSLNSVAEKCGITKGYVAMLEKNVNPKTGRSIKPSIETIVKICKGLHMNVDQVFDLLDDDYIIKVNQTAPVFEYYDENELHIIGSYRKLNDAGKANVMTYVDYIVSIDNYKK